MIELRRSKERGHADHGWLKSWHTFSFADYYDTKFMDFGRLRVINEDRIEPGRGFDTHPHRDMEIVTYVISGALKHKDSMGNSTVIRPGEVQRMSAGTGILHSEFNALSEHETHLLQIWILPERMGVEPSYGQADFTHRLAENRPALVISKSGQNSSVSINQDVNIYAGMLKAGAGVGAGAGAIARANEGSGNDGAAAAGAGVKLHLAPGRLGWLQVISGEGDLGGQLYSCGDGLAIRGVTDPVLHLRADTHFLFFDLPG